MGQDAVENGASVSLASSSDDRHPPSNIVDGDSRTFWVSTGLYPQEFIIELDQPYDISEVKLIACNIKQLSISKCETQDADVFSSAVQDIKFGPEANGQLIDQTFKASFQAKHVKFTILEGWSDFCAVYKVGLIS